MLPEAEDEQEALAAIYGEKYMRESRGDGVVATVKLDVGSLDDGVLLYFEVSPDYPTASSALWRLEDPFQLLDARALDALEAALDATCAAHEGSVVLFALIETVREALVAVGDRIAETERQIMEAREHEEEAAMEAMAEEEEEEEEEEKVQVSRPKGPSVVVPEIFHGEPLEDRKSVFQAHLAHVTSVDQVEAVKASLLSDRRILRATHNILAYRITLPSTNATLHNNDDDGEDAAGGRLAHLLELVGATNVVVVVSRWYGGVQLGPDRFRHINNVARQLLDSCGFVTRERRGAKAKTKAK